MAMTLQTYGRTPAQCVACGAWHLQQRVPMLCNCQMNVVCHSLQNALSVGPLYGWFRTLGCSPMCSAAFEA